MAESTIKLFSSLFLLTDGIHWSIINSKTFHLSREPIECPEWSEGLFISSRRSHKFVSAFYSVGDSEFDHLWGGRSGEGSMMLQDTKLFNDPED